MAKPVPMPPPGFDDLPIDEKVEYVQELWDRIAPDADALPLRGWQAEILRSRVDALKSDPDSAIPWTEVRERLRRKYGD